MILLMRGLYYNFALYSYKDIRRDIESDVVERESEIDLSLFPELHAHAENSMKHYTFLSIHLFLMIYCI